MGQDSYSQSTSESNTLGASLTAPFSVGGGLKVPTWAVGAAVILVALIGAAWAYKKFIK